MATKVTYYSINVKESAESVSALADLLRHIASQLDEGYTSGYYPTWEMETDEG